MQRRRITANVLANLLNAGTTIAAAIVSVPLILHYLDLDGYGVWVLAQTAIVYVATAETGFGPAVQRYVSVAHGARDLPAASRIVWSASAFYLVVGALVAGAIVLAAPAIVSPFDVPQGLEDDAIAMFRITGPVMLLALLAAGLANVLQGVERFGAAAAATGVSALVFLAAAAILLASGRGLEGLAEAALAQYAVGVVLRAWLVRDVLAAAPLAWVSRREAGGLLGFSARMQVNVLSTLINSQTDKIIVGLIASTAVVGAVGIGSQVAEAGRFLGAAALGPIIARLAIIHGEGAAAQLGELYGRIEFVWLRAGVGLTVIGCAVMPPLIEGWLGPDTGDAALYGAVLTVAYGVNVLPGPAIAYLRAIGRPGLEARYGGALILLNVLLTVPGGLLFGPVGVVAATAVTYLGGTGWFLLRVRGAVPHAPVAGPSRLRAAAALIVAAGAALAWGLLMVELLPQGVALAGVGLGAGAAFLGYLAAATGAPLSPAGVRDLLVAERAPG